MMRAFFLAVGISFVLVGIECLVIERAELVGEQSVSVAGLASRAMPSREITPPENAPWLLMSAGAVVILYTFTLPKRIQG